MNYFNDEFFLIYGIFQLTFFVMAIIGGCKYYHNHAIVVSFLCTVYMI